MGRHRRTLAERAQAEAQHEAFSRWMQAQPRSPLPEPKLGPPSPRDEARFRAAMDGWQHVVAREKARLAAVREASRMITDVYRTYTTRCVICGEAITARRRTRQTCSARCRQRLARASAPVTKAR